METPVEVNALAINVAIPQALQWVDVRDGVRYTLHTLNVRILPSGHLAAKAYGRAESGGRGAYVAFPVPASPELEALIGRAAERASALWANHAGLRG